MLKAVNAIYKEGKLIFADEQMAPKDGTEVIVTFFGEVGEVAKTPAEFGFTSTRNLNKSKRKSTF